MIAEQFALEEAEAEVARLRARLRAAIKLRNECKKATKDRCKAITAGGTQCAFTCVKGAVICEAHRWQELRRAIKADEIEDTPRARIRWRNLGNGVKVTRA